MRKINLHILKFCFLFSALLFSSGILHAQAEEIDPLKYIDESYIERRDWNVKTQSGIENIVSKVNPAWSDEEKALFVHDYLIESAQYDYDAYENGYIGHAQAYTAYGIIVLKKGVCSGYADAYAQVMNRLGIECKKVSSKILNHAWNMIKIKGKWYYVDCTWDDPGRGDSGKCFHDDFMVSRDALYNGTIGSGHKSTDWMCEGKNVYANDKTSKDHDNWYWKYVDKPITYTSAGWMYQKSDGVYIHQYPSNTDTKVSSFAGLDLSGNAWAFSYGDYQLVANKYNVILRDRKGSTIRIFSVSKEIGNTAYISGLSRKDGKIILNIYSTGGSSITSTLDWTDLFEEKNTDSTLPTGQINAFIGCYMVSADKDRIYLMDEHGIHKETFYLDSDIKSTRYIHDIAVVNGAVKYTTWLRTPTGSGSDTQVRKPVSYLYDGWQKKFFSGSCGDNVTWSYVNGKLTISGTGEMDHYEYLKTPWSFLSEYFITEVSIEEGVTSATDDILVHTYKLKDLYIPSTINKVDSDALYGLGGNATIHYNGTKKSFKALLGNSWKKYDDKYKIEYSKVNITYVTRTDEGTISVESAFGKIPAKPANPVKKYYEFKGWYTDTSCTQSYTFNTALSEDTTLYAKWEDPDKLETDHAFGNLNWNIKNGVLAISGSGAMPDATNPAVVPWYAYKDRYTKVVINSGVSTLCSYAFYNTEKLTDITIPYSINDAKQNSFRKMGADTTIHFQGTKSQLKSKVENAWDAISACNISCTKVAVKRISDGKIEPTTYLDKYAVYKKPSADPTRVGYRFDGWYTSEAFTEEFDFSKKITDDTNIYAKWTKVFDLAEEHAFGTTTWKIVSGTLTIAGSGDMPQASAPGDIPWQEYKDKFTKVEIKNGVSSISAYAFSDAIGLAEITIPMSVQKVCTNAFRGLNNSTTIKYIFTKSQLKENTSDDWDNISRCNIDCKMVQVEFVSFGKVVGNNYLGKNMTVSPCSVSMRAGYTFDGWYTSEEYTQKFDFNTKISDDTFIYAKWIPLAPAEESGSKDDKGDDKPTDTQSGEGSQQTQPTDSQGNEGTQQTQPTDSQGGEGTQQTQPVKLSDEHPYGNVTWKIENDKLTISGKGDMPEENRYEDVPWYEYRNHILTIEIEEGITSISNYLLYDPMYSCTIYLPQSITKIQPRALKKQTNCNYFIIYSGAKADLKKMMSDEDWKYFCDNCSCSKIKVDYISDNAVLKTEYFESGSIAEEPTIAQRAGYTFNGWYRLIRGDMLMQYTFDYPLYEDTCLYAEWTAVSASGSESTNPYSEQGYGYQYDDYQYDEGYESTYSYEYVPSSSYENPSETTSGKSKTATGSADDSDMQEDEIHEIPANAYKNRTNLKSFTIGAEIEKIGSSAFSGCKNLKKITIKAKNLKSIGKNSFKGIKKGAKITIICKDKKTFSKLVKQIKKAGAKKAIFKFKKG
ncbi:Listeria/Bacterioides repeat-containing protein [Butyrivibrio sp. ob235]|uniref:InlB B-repeat-containing protein n=1 Tax=Butyrivibrio sp. ob235 TaxID=1761780 RepID=UPI0008BA6D89|nr:InlB B-repeat-containing protein [Butyrivibrio sp. ob235]SEK70376.1 Listeria/Bacterioides repeat-containing protein [Butyrivibrio sp. ob235]